MALEVSRHQELARRFAYNLDIMLRSEQEACQQATSAGSCYVPEGYLAERVQLALHVVPSLAGRAAPVGLLALDLALLKVDAQELDGVKRNVDLEAMLRYQTSGAVGAIDRFRVARLVVAYCKIRLGSGQIAAVATNPGSPSLAPLLGATPLLAAAILDCRADAFHALEEWDQEAEERREAAALLLRDLEPAHPAVLLAQQRLAQTLFAASKVTSALDLSVRAVQAAQASFGWQDPVTIELATTLASFLIEYGDIGSAQRILDQLSPDDGDDTLLPPSPASTDPAFLTAEAKIRLAKNDEDGARLALERAMREALELYGVADERYSDRLQLYADLLVKIGSVQGAISQQSKAVDYLANRPSSGFRTPLAFIKLSDFANAANNPGAAKYALQECVAWSARYLPPNHIRARQCAKLLEAMVANSKKGAE